MTSILCIGASGFLGSYITSRFKADVAKSRFESSSKCWKYAQTGSQPYDFVFLLARACRKEEPRRDGITMLNEISGITKIINANPKAHIVFTSTKCVYGISQQKRTITRDKLGNYFQLVLDGNFMNQTIDLPDRLDTLLPLLSSSLPKEHKIYSDTKICGELLIRNCAASHTIMRIWDII
jgi:nucleoside-diphosphate-sugar epimerase